jgi:hypothetical protein
MSRSFLDNIDEYIYVLTDLLSELRLIHAEIKTKLKLDTELAKWNHISNRVFPEGEDVADFEPSMEQYLIKKRKLDKTVETIKGIEDCVQTRVYSMLLDSIKSTLCEHGKLWNSFENIFETMVSIAAPLCGEWKKIGYISHQPKQKQQREARLKLLNKWIYCSNKCVVAWEQFRSLEGKNCSTLVTLVGFTKKIVLIFHLG